MEEGKESLEKIYQILGCKNRRDYLSHLAENYGVDSAVVTITVGTLGPYEDFDGLITTLEDYSYLDVFA